MPTFTAKLTTAGLALYTAAVATSTPVELTAMAVGDGLGNPTIPNPDQTALVREVYRNDLSSIMPDANDPTILYAELLIPPEEGGWAIREVGVFTVDGILFAIANFPETYKPVVVDGSVRELIIRFAMKISNAASITLVIDSTIVGATRAWVLSTITPAYLFPGGLTGQVMSKLSNADGDWYWRDATEAFNISVDVITEIQTAAASQDIFNLGTLTTDGVAVYVEGSREFEFTILTATQLQLSRTLNAGDRVMFAQNEPNEALRIRKTVTSRAFFIGQI